MTTPSATSHEIEPAPDFNARGLVVLERWQQGEFPFQEAVKALNEMSHEATRSGHLANQGRAEHFLGYIQHYRGNLATSIMHYEKARALFAMVGNRKRVATIDLNQGENYRNKGDFIRARRLYRSAYESAATLDDVPLKTMAIANEGLSLISLKDYATARTALEEGLRLSYEWTVDDVNLHTLSCELHHGLATLDLLADQPESAWQHATEAVAFARKGGESISIGYAARILGDVMTEFNAPVEEGMPTTPDECYRMATEAFKHVNAEGELGRTLYSHAKSLARRNKRRAASLMFREAMVIFTRLGMTDDAAKAAEAQLKVLHTGTLRAEE
jgi:tetratricopeptide (TPR) repeat protein